MSNSQLPTYLNDHLGGSVMALELLDHLIDSRKDAPLAATLVDVRAEVQADQKVLQRVLQGLGESESVIRKAAGWLAEKAARLKLSGSGLEDDSLELLEALETLSLGIEGKRGLWRALSEVARDVPSLVEVDFAQLVSRAEAQRSVVERERLVVARQALR